MAVSTVKLNGTTLMTVNDTTATASDVNSSKYFYTAAGVRTAGTSSGSSGSNIFTVTLTLTNGQWIPDKTFAEITAAHNAGDTIIVSINNDYYDIPPQVECHYYSTEDGFEENFFSYSVAWFDYVDTGFEYVDTYTYTASELTLDDHQTYGPPTTLVEKTITENGRYYPSTDSADGYSFVNVKVNWGSNGHIATITNNTTNSSSFVRLNNNGLNLYQDGEIFNFINEDTLKIYASGKNTRKIIINGIEEVSVIDPSVSASYTYSLPDNDILVDINYVGITVIVSITDDIKTVSITQNGRHDVSQYDIAEVNVSGGSGGSSSSSSDNVVRFIDYDGTVLHEYTPAQANALAELPANPTHTGLTAQGWNWTLQEIKNQLTAIPDGDIFVGQMYVTDDDKTRIYCKFNEGRLHPYLGICPNGTVTVNWGDESPTETMTGTSLTTVVTLDHEYSAEGDYVITLTAESGTFSFYGNSNTSYLLRKDTTTSANIHKVYTSAIYKIELGSAARIGYYSFTN